MRPESAEATMLRQRLRISARIGLIVALIVSSTVTAFEVWQNPGGIYRSTSGTNWTMVQETWSSWFLPTLLIVGGAAVALMLVMMVVGAAADKKKPTKEAESKDSPSD